jgi:uncharacterized protein
MDAAIIGRIALETAIPESSVSAAVALLKNGATGPFIVHYRKEATGGLDEIKVRAIQDRMSHYREVLDQRALLLKSLSEQGRLTDDLRARIESCFLKAELDDMQHQFRPRKKTRAIEAIEKGLEPLAQYFWNQEMDAWSVEEHIDVFVDPAKGIINREQALQGVVDIIAEYIWENAEHRKALRDMLWSEGNLISSVVPAKVGQKTKYNMYYDRRESVTTIPSHRVLAIRRGCKEGILISSIEGDNTKALEFLQGANIKDRESIFAPVIEAAVRESYHRILRPMIETEVRTQLKERADREAIKVFQENLANLLLSPPAGPIVAMGVDWGKSNECNIAVVSEAGKFLEGAKIRFVSNSKPAPNETSRKNSEDKARPEPLPSVPETAIEPAADPEINTASPLTESTAIEAPAFDSNPPEEVPDGISFIVHEPADVESATAQEMSVETQSATELCIAAETESLPLAENAAIQEMPATQSLEISTPSISTPEPEIPAEPAVSISETSDPRQILRDLVVKHKVRAISIGTGTGARELESILRQLATEEGLDSLIIAAVNDAGIAIYSSSRIAREEFPDFSASARCAVSLARRLQDPLSELVKIDPKLIGVGQYQHDVDQKELHRGLLQTVQYCVNNVGVNPNKAGESLLRYVSGLNDKLARKFVACRNAQDSFPSRAAMKIASGLDETIYQQAAAFLRISDSENPLDRTAIHPESYSVVETMAATLGMGINDLIENKELIASLNLENFVTETIGLPTLNDICDELMHPGRDPRKAFQVPKFRSDLKEMADLKPGMILEGTVTNVTNFGAFVDIGVRQDGLVHLSQMSNRFIRDPREAVKVGDVVQVKVISIETETKRIGLSMKTSLPGTQRRRPKQQRRGQRPPMNARRPEGAATGSNTGTEADATPAQAEIASRSGARQRPNKPQDPSHRNRQRGARKPQRTEAVQQQKDLTPREPEPSLQEKIAILQSKFRGIH